MRQSIFMKRHYLFDSKLYYCFLHVILFFYIYSVQFVGVPFSIGTRVFMGMIGFFLFLLKILKTQNAFVFTKQFLKIYLVLFFISFISLLSLLYNRTTDLEFFLKYPVSITIIIFASYFVTKLVSYKNNAVDQIPLMMKLFINVVFIQIVISLIMFIFLPIRDILTAIQVTSDQELKILKETLEFRLVGFGSKFFGSGIINGFSLILIGSILKYNSNIKINVFKYSMFFLFIFVFGMMMARTTLVGALLAFAIIFWPSTSLKFNLNQFKNNSKFLFYFFSVPIIIVFGIYTFLPALSESLNMAFNFGFEMFVNYFNNNSLESVSTNRMKEMYIWPSTFKTYLIGDGLYSNTITGGYYMGTDIGFLRLIYYFGVFGLFSYLLFQFQIAYFAYLRNHKYKYMFVVIFMYCLILNYKGFTDLFFLTILFYLNNNYQDKITNEKNVIYNSISAK